MAETTLEPVSPSSSDYLFIKALVGRCCPTAKVAAVRRNTSIQQRKDFERFRDERIAGDPNETLLFHGTANKAAVEVLAHPDGLDPRFSNGGFYGHGIYLAEDPAYPIGGRYVHRLDPHGRRMELLVVRAALGCQQEMGGSNRISQATRQMRMPDLRPDGPHPAARYDSVRGGPHRPYVSGTGDSGLDASIVHVVYDSRQCLVELGAREGRVGRAST